jgi:hypothetical protein
MKAFFTSSLWKEFTRVCGPTLGIILSTGVVLAVLLDIYMPEDYLWVTNTIHMIMMGVVVITATKIIVTLSFLWDLQKSYNKANHS